MPIFAKAGIHPNTVSLTGAACGMLAAAAYYFSPAHGLLWIAALATLVTGAQYWEQARKALSAGDGA